MLARRQARGTEEAAKLGRHVRVNHREEAKTSSLVFPLAKADAAGFVSGSVGGQSAFAWPAPLSPLWACLPA